MFKKYYKEVLILIGLVFAILYFFDPNTEEVEVKVPIKVKVPVIQKSFDTVYVPKPYPVYKMGKVVREVDTTYYSKYIELKNDSVRRDSLFKKTIEINRYKERVEDDTLSIDLNLSVRGDLLDYQLSYKTKPRDIFVDTTLKVKIPTKAKLFGGVGARMPLRLNTGEVAPVVYGGLYLKTKGDNLITLEIDPKNISVGYAWKF